MPQIRRLSSMHKSDARVGLLDAQASKSSSLALYIPFQIILASGRFLPFSSCAQSLSAAVIWRIPLESGVERLQPWLGPSFATRSIAWYVYSLLTNRLEMR